MYSIQLLYTYHIFFIHSSVIGRLGCFHVLFIVNIAAVNIGMSVNIKKKLILYWKIVD